MAAVDSTSDGTSTPGECVSLDTRGPSSALATWCVPGFSKVRAKQLWSAPFTVGPYSCRLLLYPRGDSQALPGYLSLYLQVSDPKAPAGKWDCFASYRLGVRHAQEPATRTVARDSWHRFSGKKRSHGWCDFTAVGPLVDPRTGFCAADTLVLTAEVTFLTESVQFDALDGSTAQGATSNGRTDGSDANEAAPEGGRAHSSLAAAGTATAPGGDVLSGKFTWRVLNFSLFQARVCSDVRGAWAWATPRVWRAHNCGPRRVVPRVLCALDATLVLCPCLSHGELTHAAHMCPRSPTHQEMIKTQKIMSPVFPAADCALRLSVYATQVAGAEYLSMCLESKDTEKGSAAGGAAPERSCWCLFRMSVLPSAPEPPPGGGTALRPAVFKDSYGRFAADTKSGDNTSLGWNDFQLMSTFLDPASGFLHDDTATFSVVFHVIKESATFTRTPLPALNHGGRGRKGGAGAGDHHHQRDRDRGVGTLTGPGMGPRGSGVSGGVGDAVEVFGGKFVWRIDHFTRLKDLLKKRKITGLCIKSRRFQVGGRDLRLIIYPRGQSQPPQHLSMFLEVTHPRAPSPDWSCFVSHRLAVVCQHGSAAGDAKAITIGNSSSNGGNGNGSSSTPDKSVAKESQNRYNRTAKDWGWREFITLTSLFDAEAGYLVNDSVVFSAEVLILKESSELRTGSPASELTSLPAGAAPAGQQRRVCASFAWRVENFGAFKEILETRKIFSRYFSAGSCELRIGVYESFDTLCIYLESEPPSASGSSALVDARNYWVRYRIAVVHQRSPDKTTWRESSICTRTWNNSVLQFMKASEMVEPDAGLVARDTAVFACEVLECCLWFEFGDVELGNPPPESVASATPAAAASAAAGGDAGGAAGKATAPPAGKAQAPPRLLQGADDEPQAAADGGFNDDDAPGTSSSSAAVTVAETGDGGDGRGAQGEQQPQQESSAEGSADVTTGAGAMADPVAAFRSLAARLGAHFAARDEGPPIVPSPAALVAAAKAQAENAAACIVFATAFGGFVRDPVRVRRVLLPVSAGGKSGGGKHSSNGGATADDDAHAGKCLASMLLDVPQLAGHVTEALVQVLALALRCNAKGGDHEEGPDGVATEDDVSSTSSPADATWDDALADVAQLILAALTPPTPAGESTASSGDAHPSADSPAAATAQHMPPASTALVCSLLRSAPAAYIQGIALLAPHIVHPSRHADLVPPLLAAARADDLSSASRMAVLTSLSMLHLDANCATTALQEAIGVLPLLHEGSHLHTVATFALRVASHGALRTSVLPAVRARAKDATEAEAKGLADAAALATQLSSDLGPVVMSIAEVAWGGAVAVATGANGKGNKAQSGKSHKRTGSSGGAPVVANGTSVAHEGDGAAEAGAVEGESSADDHPAVAPGLTWVAEAAVLVECVANPGGASASDAVSLLCRGVARHDVGAACLILALHANGRPAARVAAVTSTICEALARTSGAASCRAVAHDVFAAVAHRLLSQSEELSDDKAAAASDDAVDDTSTGLETLLHGVISRALSSTSDPASRSTSLEFLCDACGPVGQWCSRVLALVLRAASRANADAAAATGKVKDAEAKVNAAKQAVADELTSLRKERAAAQSRAAAAEAAAQRAKADMEASIEKTARERRELAEKLRSLEAQLSWTAAERADASEALVKERDAALAQVKELDGALQRSKAATKESIKRVAKEKQALTDRAVRAETAASEAVAAAQRAAQQQQQRQQAGASGDSAATAAYLAGMEAKLRASEEYISTLERSLAEEAARHAPLYGSGLETLTLDQLEALRSIHTDGLRAVAAVLLAHQHEEQAAAAAAAAASAVVALGVDDELDMAGTSGSDAMTASSGITRTGTPGFMGLGSLVNGYAGGGGHTLWGTGATDGAAPQGLPSLGLGAQWADRKDGANRETWY